jgi:hypothetical protein
VTSKSLSTCWNFTSHKSSACVILVNPMSFNGVCAFSPPISFGAMNAIVCGFQCIHIRYQSSVRNVGYSRGGSVLHIRTDSSRMGHGFGLRVHP